MYTALFVLGIVMFGYLTYVLIRYTGQAHNIIQFVFKVEFLEDCRQAAIEQMMQEVNMKEMITKGNMQH